MAITVLPLQNPTRRKPKKWLYPLAIERRYQSIVTGIADECVAQVKANIKPILSEIRQDALGDIPQSTGWYERLRVAMLTALAGTQNEVNYVVGILPDIANRIDTFNDGEFKKVFKSVYAVDIFSNEPWLRDKLLQWEAQNIKLIRSIPEQYLDSLHGKIVAAVEAGQHPRDLAKVIEATYDIPRNRARLIARDQTSKLQGQLTRERQIDAGIDSYLWRGVLDERERDLHVEREGQQFKWTEPPSDGHPGQPIQCRCWAEGVFPKLVEGDNGLELPDFSDLSASIRNRY